MRLTEFTHAPHINRPPDLMAAFKDFLPIAMKELGIKQLPSIKLVKYVEPHEQPTFGRFKNSTYDITLGIEDRHPLDVLRTLAHELVHYRQMIQHKLGKHSGKTGSDAENEANAVSGVIMRHFDKKFPNYFNDESVDTDESNQYFETATAGSTSAGAIASIASIPGSKRKVNKGKNGLPQALQAKNSDGTAKNALDIKTNIFGGTLKR